MWGLIYSVVLFSLSMSGQGTNDQAKTRPESVKKEPAQATRPVLLKRKPASESPGEQVPVKSPLDLAIRTLEQDPLTGSPPGSSGPGKPSPPVKVPAAAVAQGVPKDYHPPKQGPLSETGKDALSASQDWQSGRNTPVTGADGRVLYTFGAGLPTVICAPLRVCVIELQAGERLTGEPHIGDSVRWDVSPAVVGSEPTATTMIVIKPRAPGLDTNLLLTTDRRAYYLRLVSRSEDYIARVGFEYTDDHDRWKEQLARDAEARRKQEFEASEISPVASIENLFFDYRIEGGDANMRPVRVMDDGRKTYIQMPPVVMFREAPILVILGPNGAEMVNYRVKGDMYIVDRLFDRGALIIGVGKKARRAEIIRSTYNPKTSGAAGKKHDPYADFTKEDGKK